MKDFDISLKDVFLALLPQIINDPRCELTYTELVAIWMDAAKEIHKALQAANGKISKSEM